MLKATEHREQVGARIMLVREISGLPKGKFARAVGLTSQALWNIEGGGAYPNLGVIVRIAEEFGVSADWLLRGVRAGLPTDVAERLRAAEARLSITV